MLLILKHLTLIKTMNKKIIFPLLALTIVVIGTVFLFISNILVLDTSQLQDITELEIAPE